MLVAAAAAAVLLVSTIGSSALVFAPTLGLAQRPRASLAVSTCALALCVAVAAALVFVPLQRLPSYVWQGFGTDYFLAMAHRINGAPYPFFWSPPWVYQLGGLTPLVAAGAVLTMASAYSGRRAARKFSFVLIGMGALAVLAYVAAAAYAAVATWHGVPV